MLIKYFCFPFFGGEKGEEIDICSSMIIIGRFEFEGSPREKCLRDLDLRRRGERKG